MYTADTTYIRYRKVVYKLVYMDSWKLSTKRDRSDALTSPYKYMIGYPIHLFKPVE